MQDRAIKAPETMGLTDLAQNHTRSKQRVRRTRVRKMKQAASVSWCMNAKSRHMMHWFRPKYIGGPAL